MEFSDFLRRRRDSLGLKSSKEHYVELGGKDTLGVELRQFQQVESGKYPPSEKILLGVFQRIPPSQRHHLIRSYFKSVVDKMAGAQEFNAYLEQSLAPGLESVEPSVWQKNSDQTPIYYSEEQLAYLINNPDAMRLHKRLTLYEQWPKSKAQIIPLKIPELERLGLLEQRGDTLLPSKNLYRLPAYENSGPGPVSKAYSYIHKQVELYASKEGSPNQELAYGMQLVEPEVATIVLEQMRALKRWVQSHASTKTDDSVVPMIFVGFAKKLESREL